MDYIFTPWRYAYMVNAGKSAACLFCEKMRESDDRQALIIHRGRHCFIMLNAFPYTSGHVMIAPYEHLDQLDKLSEPGAVEMMLLAQRMETALRAAYKPDGLNLGMNIGAAAGAGVAGHIHLHVLPRWIADSNFMTTVAETRVIPEDVGTTWEKLRKAISD
jgi:ATP adenylyltransferase